MYGTAILLIRDDGFRTLITMARKKLVTIHIRPDQHVRLKERLQDTGIAVAEQIRQGIDLLLGHGATVMAPVNEQELINAKTELLLEARAQLKHVTKVLNNAGLGKRSRRKRPDVSAGARPSVVELSPGEGLK